MAPSTRRRGWRVQIICATSAILMATMAMAGEKQAKIEASRLSADNDTPISTWARCPGRTRALGGGVVQSGEVSVLNYFHMSGSGPVDTKGVPALTRDGDIPKQWYASIYNEHHETGSRKLKVLALCARAPGATIETAKFLVGAGEVGQKSVKCTESRRALGGGVISLNESSNQLLSVSASAPIDSSGSVLKTRNGDVAKSWYAAVTNDTDSQRAFRVYAICARDSNATIKTTIITVDPSETIDDKLVECPGAKRTVGGGVAFIGSPTSELRVMASGPLDDTGTTSETKDGDTATQWYAAVADFSDNLTEFKLFAICV